MEAVIVRLRSMVPPPHVAVQVPHAPHDETSQLTGQLWGLQPEEIESVGQAMPPYCGCTMTTRVSELKPPPQDFEQGVVRPQSPTSQSTGHIWLLQSCISDKTGQALPPKPEEAVTVRNL
jgi:hypothetical protein